MERGHWPLTLETFQDGLVRDAFFLREKLEKLLDRCLELTFGPIAHFPPISLAERTIGYPTRNLVNTTDVGIPAHKINESGDDRRMLPRRLECILLAQNPGKVLGTLFQLGTHRGFLLLKLT